MEIAVTLFPPVTLSTMTQYLVTVMHTVSVDALTEFNPVHKFNEKNNNSTPLFFPFFVTINNFDREDCPTKLLKNACK